MIIHTSNEIIYTYDPFTPVSILKWSQLISFPAVLRINRAYFPNRFRFSANLNASSPNFLNNVSAWLTWAPFVACLTNGPSDVKLLIASINNVLYLRLTIVINLAVFDIKIRLSAIKLHHINMISTTPLATETIPLNIWGIKMIFVARRQKWWCRS